MWPWAEGGGQTLGHRLVAQAAPHAAVHISTVRSSPESQTPCWTREGAEQGPAPSSVGGTGGGPPHLAGEGKVGEAFTLGAFRKLRGTRRVCV